MKFPWDDSVAIAYTSAEHCRWSGVTKMNNIVTTISWRFDGGMSAIDCDFKKLITHNFKLAKFLETMAGGFEEMFLYIQINL